MPGSVIANMPPQDDDQQRRIRDAERQAREQSAARSGEAMQVGSGGITVNNGGSITIQDGGSLDVLGSGSINVPSGGLNSAGSITAATDITAGGTVQGADLVSTGGASVAGALSAGSISSGNVTSSGQVQSNGAPLLSQPSYNYLVASSYKSAWIDGVTFQIGYSPSAGITKTSLAPMNADDARKLLNLTPYWGRYVWDDASSPLKVFFLAEDVQAVGFGPDVAPVADQPVTFTGPDGQPVIGNDGNPVVIPVGQAYTINYSQFVVPLVAAYHDAAATVQTLQAQIAALTTRLNNAGIA